MEQERSEQIPPWKNRYTAVEEGIYEKRMIGKMQPLHNPLSLRTGNFGSTLDEYQSVPYVTHS